MYKVIPGSIHPDYTLCNVYRIIYIVHRTLYTIRYKMYKVHCTLYIISEAKLYF